MCTWIEIAACFTLGGLYMDYGAIGLLDYERPLVFSSTERLTSFTDQGVVNREITRGYIDTIDRQVENFYGILAVGYELDFTNFRVDTQVFHMESTAHDRGDSGLKFNLRWFPFR